MQLKVHPLGEGLHPGEVLVRIDTLNGKHEEVLLDREAVVSNAVEVGSPLQRMNGHLLVELPRETMRGEWRVWVREGDLDRGG